MPLSLKALHRPPHALPRLRMTIQPMRDRRLPHPRRLLFASEWTPYLSPPRRPPRSTLHPLLLPVLKNSLRRCSPRHHFCLPAANHFWSGMRPGGGAGTASRAPKIIRPSLPLGTMCSIHCFVVAMRRRILCSTRSVGLCEIRRIRGALVHGSARLATATSFIQAGQLLDSAATGRRGLQVVFFSRGCVARRARAALLTLIPSL